MMFKLYLRRLTKSDRLKQGHVLAAALSTAEKRIRSQQLEQYRYIFNMFDHNKDGVIRATELNQAAKMLGYRLSREQMDCLLATLNVDETCVLNFEQFVEAMPGNSQTLSEDDHRKAALRMKFQEFDKNGDGLISTDEAQQVLYTELGFTDTKTKVLLKQYDVNNDGQLSYEEFIGFYTKVEKKKSLIDKQFRKFDLENKGYVSIEDAQRILGEMGFREDEIVTLVKTHDTNEDGKLQYEEFVHFWSY